MTFSQLSVAATVLTLLFGVSASAQPVSGFYVGAGAGANWLVGAEGNVVGANPADLVARALGLPNAAAVQTAAAAAAQVTTAAQAVAQQAATQLAALQATAVNPLATPAVRAAAAQALPAAQAASAQAAVRVTAVQAAAQQAQTASKSVAAAQGWGRSAKVSFDVGFVGVASVGYGFGNGLRAEVEGNYRQNDISKVRLLGVAATVGGTARSYGVMANVLYDFDPGFFGIGPSYVQPYIGAGYIDTQYAKLSASAAGLSVTANGTSGRFGYQGIAGVAVPLTWLGVPGLTLTAEYRFLGTDQPKVLADLRLGGPSGQVLQRQGFKTANFDHSALLGVRYAFNQPPPAPSPAPVSAAPEQPMPARTYLVFFDWDRADLTDRARQIIAEAAQAATRVQVTRLEVAGHADRTGTPAYNLGLGQRRAQNVAAELVRRGVAREAITVTSFGDTGPLVATAADIREPQNRRVEIVVRP